VRLKKKDFFFVEKKEREKVRTEKYCERFSFNRISFAFTFHGDKGKKELEALECRENRGEKFEPQMEEKFSGKNRKINQ
jgi:hypothetical protein